MPRATCTVAFFDLARTDAPARSPTAGRSQLQQRLDAIARLVREADGEVIKQFGNELMCAFPEPGLAVRTAVAVAKLVDGWDYDGVHVALRAGLHHGPVLEDRGDLFGDTVNIAARLTSIASPGQLITTDEVLSELDDALRGSVRPFDELRMKGSARQRRIHRVLWAPSAETKVHAQASALRLRAATGTLTLRYGARALRIDDGRDEIRLGRDSRCELVVSSDRASRFHAVIDSGRGRFVLRDQSTNGTWVRMQGSPVVTLHREELPLLGEGVVSLGERIDDESAHLIRFACH
ncbi:MAG: FHA domain-containing protein [Pseudomonadales bacterium]|nr:FHA domain-containing protein [Pseudomonadales bacterium]